MKITTDDIVDGLILKFPDVGIELAAAFNNWITLEQATFLQKMANGLLNDIKDKS